ncbi:hypothetical protein SAMN02745673_04384 [Marinactinospora thermotolerans DSM 45154]|uniref:Uncharacterized protein n=1 Tax=Marinactinospora thermotolerans DSM 45154 TaxID=1122192 RepID=A0A1T4T2T5_9ACTN|nr:hypothetical protein SAMN02745673_04384 [Marinactinospora thermotolerans DSM 45154]
MSASATRCRATRPGTWRPLPPTSGSVTTSRWDRSRLRRPTPGPPRVGGCRRRPTRFRYRPPATLPSRGSPPCHHGRNAAPADPTTPGRVGVRRPGRGSRDGHRNRARGRPNRRPLPPVRDRPWFPRRLRFRRLFRSGLRPRLRFRRLSRNGLPPRLRWPGNHGRPFPSRRTTSPSPSRCPRWTRTFPPPPRTHPLPPLRPHRSRTPRCHGRGRGTRRGRMPLPTVSRSRPRVAGPLRRRPRRRPGLRGPRPDHASPSRLLRRPTGRHPPHRTRRGRPLPPE